MAHGAHGSAGAVIFFLALFEGPDSASSAASGFVQLKFEWTNVIFAIRCLQSGTVIVLWYVRASFYPEDGSCDPRRRGNSHPLALSIAQPPARLTLCRKLFSHLEYPRQIIPDRATLLMSDTFETAWNIDERQGIDS